MKTTVATALLAIAFLSAGAFANNGATHEARRLVQLEQVNQTIVTKNQAWPIREMMTTEPCTAARCIEI